MAVMLKFSFAPPTFYLSEGMFIAKSRPATWTAGSILHGDSVTTQRFYARLRSLVFKSRWRGISKIFAGRSITSPNTVMKQENMPYSQRHTFLHARKTTKFGAHVSKAYRGSAAAKLK